MDDIENSCELVTKQVVEKDDNGEVEEEESLDLSPKLKKLFNLENY